MLVYELYRWLRRPRRGALERERQRGCMLLLTIVSLIYLESGEAAWIQSAFVRALNGLQTSSQPAQTKWPFQALEPGPVSRQRP